MGNLAKITMSIADLEQKQPKDGSLFTWRISFRLRRRGDGVAAGLPAAHRVIVPVLKVAQSKFKKKCTYTLCVQEVVNRFMQ